MNYYRVNIRFAQLIFSVPFILWMEMWIMILKLQDCNYNY